MDLKQSLAGTGFHVLPNFIDKDKLYCDPEERAKERGSYFYIFGSSPYMSETTEDPMWPPESVSVRNSPRYRELNANVKHRLESLLYLDLFTTHYIEHYYHLNSTFSYGGGNWASEYVLCVQGHNNLNYDWPLHLINAKNQMHSVTLEPGDAILYDGILTKAYSETLTSRHDVDGTSGLYDDDSYSSRLFFNYVDADGNHIEFAYSG